MKSDVPEINDIYLEKLISKLNIKSIPRYIEINPDSKAAINECFPNVDKKIAIDGGKRIMGWSIWKTKTLIEAECHAIWKSPDGEEVDITPKLIQLDKILFIEDKSIKYNGCQIDNVRINISGNSLIDDLIILSETIFDIENKGNRAVEYELHLEGEEAKLYELLQKFKMHLILMIKNGLTKNQVCFCGKAKYKKCHGKLISELKSL